ncbi:MAG: hypothetical protein IJ794_17365 [Lachnospiraceae bacterium]|nr:hypothetical protein [Lachnospiraceae bacterium]
MDIIVDWIFAIILVLQAVIVIVGWMVRFAIWLRCHKKEVCYSETCMHREWCRKKRLSQGEWDEILQSIERYSLR